MPGSATLVHRSRNSSASFSWETTQTRQPALLSHSTQAASTGLCPPGLNLPLNSFLALKNVEAQSDDPSGKVISGKVIPDQVILMESHTKNRKVPWITSF
jgi:hypothetical protein